MTRTGLSRLAVQAAAAVTAAQVLTSCVVAGGSRDGGSGGSFFFLLLPFALILLLAGLARRRTGTGGRSGRVQRFTDDDVRVNEHVLRAELSVLAEDVMRFEPHVAMHGEARDDFDAATHRYRVAQAAIDHADEPLDLVRVQRVVDEATWSMSRARAIIEGREPPEPPPTLQRPGPHGEPAVAVDDDHRPVYVDTPAAFRSGWFGAGGGLFGGLLLGSMLGGFGGGWIVSEESDGEEFDSGGGDAELGDW